MTVAYPFVQVTIDTSGLQPEAERSPGVIAVVGKGTGPAANNNLPIVVATPQDASDNFAKVVNNVVQDSALSGSLKLAFEQDPQPAKVYGVQINGNDYASGLAALEAADDVTMVSLANETDVGAAGPPPTNLLALKDHVETMSAAGHKRIGVAMIDPTVAKKATYVADVYNAVQSLKSDDGRMVMMAARGATGDVATASMAAIAGYAPQASMVLKPIRGISIPKASQYGPAEIKGLTDNDNNINPVIDPDLIPGTLLYFAEGRTFSADPEREYIDIVRVLDQVDFDLKAGLIGVIGDARITKFGLTSVKIRTEGILRQLLDQAMIDDFHVDIPVLDILNTATTSWSAGDQKTVSDARLSRAVDMFVSITYGPAASLLRVILAVAAVPTS